MKVRWPRRTSALHRNPADPPAAKTVDQAPAEPSATNGVDRAPARHRAAIREPLPNRPQQVILYTAAILLLAAVIWLLAWAATRLALLSISLVVALLLAALCTPMVRWMCRHHVPGSLAAILTLVLVVGVPAGTGFLIWRRANSQLGQLRSAVTDGVNSIRQWLIQGPLSLDSGQVDQVRALVVSNVRQAVPSAAVGAMTVLQILAAAALVLFTLFFLLSDGARLWSWVVAALPDRHQARARGAGNAGWSTLGGYVRGIVVVALIDAVAIGTALFLLGVPLFLSLTLLVFLGAFVPLIGAVVSGAVAVLVTLVTNGGGDALILAVVVLGVQQLEGNVLSPLIVGKAVRLHPVVIAFAITAGTILAGLAGALVAVPLTACVWAVATYLRSTDNTPAG